MTGSSCTERCIECRLLDEERRPAPPGNYRVSAGGRGCPDIDITFASPKNIPLSRDRRLL